MLTRETLVTAAIVVVALPVARAVRALAEGPVGEDAAVAIAFATPLLVGGRSLYSRFVDPARSA